MKYHKNVYKALSLITQFSINMLVPILACTLFGAWLGEKLTISWLAIPFFVIGALAGMRNVFLFARRIYQPAKHADKNHSSNIEEKAQADVKETE